MKRKKRAKKSRTKLAKENIQAGLRSFVIQRDGGCILRDEHIAGECGGYTNAGDLILQAEHLNGRANSISYAEPDNCVCLCRNHHIFFKKRNPALYWFLIRKILPKARWAKIEAWIQDKTSHRVYTQEWEAKATALQRLTTT